MAATPLLWELSSAQGQEQPDADPCWLLAADQDPFAQAQLLGCPQLLCIDDSFGDDDDAPMSSDSAERCQAVEVPQQSHLCSTKGGAQALPRAQEAKHLGHGA